MASNPTPKQISKIAQRYIDKYYSETEKKDEYIYQVPTSELDEFGDFLRTDKGRVFFCFYPLSEQEYDENHKHFATAQFIQPNYLGLKDDKLKLGLNIVIPTRNGEVDRTMLVEIIAHELNHAYTTYHEIKQKHVSHPIGLFASLADMFKSKKHKYTYTDKTNRYINIMPTGSGTLHDDFRWIGYFGVQTEVNANLAGINAYLYEHNGDASKLSDCRTYILFQRMRDTLEKLKENATTEDWMWAQKNATYIYNRKEESVSQFKNRYIKYYENLFDDFQRNVDKIVNKYKNKSDLFKTGQENINNKNIQHQLINQLQNQKN